MEKSQEVINKVLVDIFNYIIKIEENTFKNSEFSNLSITEVHTIEAVGMYNKPTMGEVAQKLDITVGTLTVAINNLSKKEYVEKHKSIDDKRVVKLGLSKTGRLVFRMHKKFHDTMVKSAIESLNNDELIALSKALSNLHNFFKKEFVINQ